MPHLREDLWVFMLSIKKVIESIVFQYCVLPLRYLPTCSGCGEELVFEMERYQLPLPYGEDEA